MNFNLQNIMVLISVIVAVIYLYRKFSAKKSNKGCIDKDCGCG